MVKTWIQHLLYKYGSMDPQNFNFHRTFSTLQSISYQDLLDQLQIYGQSGSLRPIRFLTANPVPYSRKKTTPKHCYYRDKCINYPPSFVSSAMVSVHDPQEQHAYRPREWKQFEKINVCMKYHLDIYCLL